MSRYRETLTLLGQEGSDIRYGKQVILPIEDSLLYVQPLFVTAESLGIPELKKVALVYGEEVVMANTFDQAITDLFGFEEPEEPTEPEPPEEPGEPGGPDEPSGEGQKAERLLERAASIYEQMQQALADGDLEQYAQLEERLGQLLRAAERLSN